LKVYGRKSDYRLVELRAVDLFPHTPHVELLAHLIAK
jgi:tRNA/tmRNA/rRNA uracil-C5-methylase (TrmA/RlmC/RlmD family)